jgi:hypothetical protein
MLWKLQTTAVECSGLRIRLGTDQINSINYSVLKNMLEVTAGLEPAKTGFADQRLGLFGIATSESYFSRILQGLKPLFGEASVGAEESV